MKRKRHGGLRNPPGGAPRTGRVPVTVRMLPDRLAVFRRRAFQAGLPLGVYLETWFEPERK